MSRLSNKQMIALGIIVMVLLVLSFIKYYRYASQRTGVNSSIQIIEPAKTASGSSSVLPDQPVIPPQPQTICVHVAGKVKSPGVYNLPPDCRVMDAIKAAGGSFQNADLESINLAQKLSDGVQVYISPKGKVPPPARSVVRRASSSVTGESKPVDTGGTGESSGISKLSAPGDGTVNINTADLNELQRLPGIGPSMAQRIIDYRNANGKFSSIDELDEVKGIGPAKLEKMRPFVTI